MKKGFCIALLLTLCVATGIGLAEGISGDWMDFQLSIDGTAYALPMPVSVFLDEGWTMQSPDETLKPYQYTFTQQLSKDGKQLSVQIINLGIDELPLSECLIGEVSVDGYYAERNLDIVLPQGIAVGSSRDDVDAAFGQPGRLYEGTSMITYTYESDSYSKMEIKLDPETGLVSALSMRNFLAPDDYNDAAYAAPDEVPQAVLDYAPPAELGDDLFSFAIQVDGKLYSVPASYQYMESQGWKIGGRITTPKVRAWGYERMVSLVYGGYSISTQLANLSPRATAPENCFVTTIRIEENSNLDVQLPRGIHMGMSKAELDAALEGFDVGEGKIEISEISSSWGYTVKKAVLEEVYIVVDKETDKVKTIQVQCQP